MKKPLAKKTDSAIFVVTQFGRAVKVTRRSARSNQPPWPWGRSEPYEEEDHRSTIMKLSTLAEHQIRKAEAEGQFRDLKGAGKPLGVGQDGSAEAIGFRIMAEAGALPREIALRKEVAEAARILAAEADPAARRAAQARLAELELRLAIEVEARRRFGRD
jgi:hypothetical protein